MRKAPYFAHALVICALERLQAAQRGTATMADCAIVSPPCRKTWRARLRCRTIPTACRRAADAGNRLVQLSVDRTGGLESTLPGLPETRCWIRPRCAQWSDIPAFPPRPRGNLVSKSSSGCRWSGFGRASRQVSRLSTTEHDRSSCLEHGPGRRRDGPLHGMRQ
jgi:hypothetical protein